MTADSNGAAGDDRIHRFITSLEQLDVGAHARLKRNAGSGLADARDVLGLFYRLLPPGIPQPQHERYFLIATLYPLADSGAHRNLGATLRAARSPKNGAGLDRRVEVLLDSDAEQLPFRLRQAVRFAQSSRVPVNWAKLLRDVLWWDHPDRFVQLRWAESYFREVPPNQSGRARG